MLYTPFIVIVPASSIDIIAATEEQGQEGSNINTNNARSDYREVEKSCDRQEGTTQQYEQSWLDNVEPIQETKDKEGDLKEAVALFLPLHTTMQSIHLQYWQQSKLLNIQQLHFLTTVSSLWDSNKATFG